MRRFLMVVAMLGAGLLAGNQPVAEAGRSPSPGSASNVVAPYATINYRNECFYGGETATVIVAGDGDARLRVTVYDEYGNYITSDTGYTCLVSWSPRWTGRFTIKVTNLGNCYVAYTLVTN